MNNMIIENAKIMSKGQITLPKDIRSALGVETGDRVTLISEGNRVIIMNSAVYAMKILQDGMIDEATKAGLNNDDDIVNMIITMRREETNESID